MSILIKGLNIPKDDELILRITPDGKVAPYDKLFGYRNKYKAIDIPSHGRLIDADKMVKEYHNGSFDVVKVVKAMPTIIEAEE